MVTSETSKIYRFLLGNYWKRAKFVLLIGDYWDQQGIRDFFSVTFVTADKEKNKRFLKLTEDNFLRLFFFAEGYILYISFCKSFEKSELCSSWEIVFMCFAFFIEGVLGIL